MTAELWSWVLSLTGLLGIWLAGNKHRAGWWVLLGSEALWLAYAVSTNQSGFIVGAAAWAVVYARNIWKWRPA